ncbi:MAG: leucine-rich repeat domain-containing protein [Eubacteriaceae bacterium]
MSIKKNMIVFIVMFSATILILGGCTPQSQNTTPEECFNFNSISGTIVDYKEEACGLDVVIPPMIGGVTVEHIDAYTFHHKQLTSIIIPETVTDIGYFSFASNQLSSVTIPSSLTNINDHSFADNQLILVDLPNSVTRIGEYAFAYNELDAVIIPNSVTHIEKCAFFVNKLTSISIPNSLIIIGRRAFANNEIFSVTIGANVAIDNTPGTIGMNEGFKLVYDSGGKLAGTYNYIDGEWIPE